MAKKLLDIYLNAQKAGLPDSNMTYSLYNIAKYRGEHEFGKMMDVVESAVPTWNENIASALDLSLPEIKELSKQEEVRLINYFKSRAEKSGAKNVLSGSDQRHDKHGRYKIRRVYFNEALKKAKDQGKLLFMVATRLGVVLVK